MSDTVTEGREAWSRLRSRERTTWNDWLAVARALVIGREQSLKIANRNSPHGKRYTAAMRQWIDANGFDGLTQQERNGCFRLMQHLPEIEQWREGLDDRMRRQLNHPDSIWMHYRRSGKAPAPPKARHLVRSDKPAQKGSRAIHWPQEAIRRGADAMRESRSSDYFVMARLCLQAAVRSADDIAALLDAPAPKHAPKVSAPITANIGVL